MLREVHHIALRTQVESYEARAKNWLNSDDSGATAEGQVIIMKLLLAILDAEVRP